MTDYISDRRRIYKRDLAHRNNCTTRTIDLHTARGILPPPHRDEVGRRFWWSEEIARHEARLCGGPGE